MRSKGYGSTFLCVCLSVTTLAKALLGSTARKRYVQHWYKLFSVLSLWSFERPSVQMLWREKANMLMSNCLPTSSGADEATFCLNFCRQSLKLFKSLAEVA